MPQSPIERLTLCLPAYNEEESIANLIEEAAVVLAGEGIAWNIIVVDDGSRDGTAAEVERIRRTIQQARLVRHPRNLGLGRAILTGLRSALELGAGPEHLVVCMDADLTHPPKTIPAMRAAAEGGADLVIASRYQSGSRQVGVPLHRRILSVGARLLFAAGLGLAGVRDYTCGFRAFRASILATGFERFGPDGLITRSGFACTDELLVHLAMVGAVIREVPFILRYDRKRGSSKMDVGNTIIETLKLLRAHRKASQAPKQSGFKDSERDV